MIKNKLIGGFRYTSAIIGFGGEPTLWWMRFLKKDFYHCMLAIGQNDTWILIDPLIHYTDLMIIKSQDIEKMMQKQGYKTIQTQINEPSQRRAYLAPYTCVETAKRFLGVREKGIFTPFQLYKFLKQKN